jgi:hypothetical protein
VTGDLPFWRTFQFRVRTRDEAGNWGAWALSNTINGWRRQERHFSLEPAGRSTQRRRDEGQKPRIARSRRPCPGHFEGNGAAVVMPAAPGLGTAQVCIDPGSVDESCLIVDQALSADRSAASRCHVTGLSTGGTHVLQVTVVSGTVKLDGAVFTE